MRIYFYGSIIFPTMRPMTPTDDFSGSLAGREINKVYCERG